MAGLEKPWISILHALEDESTSGVNVLDSVTALLNLTAAKNTSESDSLPPVSIPTDVFDRAFSIVLRRIDATWLDQVSLLVRVQDLMRVCDPLETLFSLLEAVKRWMSPSGRLDFLLILLSFYVERILDGVFTAAITPAANYQDSDEYTQCFASLPDRMAHLLMDDDDQSPLLSTNYFRRICNLIHKSLCLGHVRMKTSRSVSLIFCGSLMGKMVISGQEDAVTALLLKVIRNGEEDFVWRRIAQQLFSDIPSRAYESILLNLLCTLENGKQLVHILGYNIQDAQVELILTSRLLYNRIILPPKDVLLYRNLFAFFCALDDGASKFKSVVGRLMESWVTVYGQKYMALQYEISVTKAILIAIGILRTCVPFDSTYGEGLLKTALRGVEKRLSSTNPAVRRNGMVIGEAVTQMVEPSPGNFLKFDYEDDDETRAMKALLDCHASQSTNDSDVNQPVWIPLSNLPPQPVFEETSSVEPVKASSAVEELDSDDDLVPYALPSRDSVKSKATINQPKYLQDCYDGLCQTDDVTRRIACLKALPILISKQPDLAEHMTVDLLKVLLGMQIEGSLREVSAERHEALIAVTTQNPKPAGMFLGNEAISRNYGIGVRLEIFHVLRSAAERLDSNGKTLPSVEMASTPVLTNLLTTGPKTRRLASASKPVVATENRLTHVSRYYILPLLGYGITNKTTFAVLHTEEAMVLTHLINTLGLLVHYSRNVPDNAALAAMVLEFVWEFRMHSDTSVKQAVLYCVRFVVPTIPLDFVSGSNNRLIDQIRLFLEDVTRNDPHTESVDLAVQAEAMLSVTLHKALLAKGAHLTGAVQTGPWRRDLTLKMIRDISLAPSSLSFDRITP